MTYGIFALYLIYVCVGFIYQWAVIGKKSIEIDKNAARMCKFFASFTRIETLVVDSFKVGRRKAQMGIIHV